MRRKVRSIVQVKAIVSTENKRSRAYLVAIVMLAIAFISATVLRSIFSSTDMYRGAYDKLNEKRNNVIALTTAATVTSYAITAVPDDAGTPIANQLMEIAKNFAFVLAAIVLEKHLLTVMGFVFFTVFVPISCVLVAISGFLSPGNANRQLCRQAAAKFFIFGLVLFLATPTSVLLSSMIDESYQASVDTMIAQGNEVHEQTNETANAASSSTNEKEKTANSNTPSNPIEFVQQQFSNVTSNVGSAVENAGKVVTGALDKASATAGNLIELFGVMVATSILIPIIVPIIMYLAFKALFGQQLSGQAQEVKIIAEQVQQALPETTQSKIAGRTPAE
jgi:hypothetical protein